MYETYSMSLSLIIRAANKTTNEEITKPNKTPTRKFENVQLFFIFKNNFCY